MATKPVSRAQAAKIARRSDTVGAYAGKGWVQAVAFVMLLGFTIMAVLAMRTYALSMPLPDKIVGNDGKTIATQEQILHGQELFQGRGLQQYGSVLGHGAYLGPDYTAEYLRLTTDAAVKEYREQGKQDPRELVKNEWRKENKYDEQTKTITWSAGETKGYQLMLKHYRETLMKGDTSQGLFPNAIKNDEELHDLVAFFGWTAWASAADRPDQPYSYTNNWPSEPNVDNKPTADLMVWSALSLIALIGGTGLMFAIYGRWSRAIGWHAEEAPVLDFRQPDEVRLTPSQKAACLLFATILVLFLLQALVGALTEHYREELTGFFGIDMGQLLPYTVSRTWHLQLSLFWTAGAFLAGGIFIAPLITRREPKKQGLLTYVLIGAVVFVVLGSLLNEWFSQKGLIPKEFTGFFSQQWEFLDLPRFFQILLTAGMFIWIVIVWRTLSARLKGSKKTSLPWLFLFSGLAIPMFYAVGLLAGQRTHVTVAEFWRFWVVHLWVEDFLELFTTVMVAYIFVLLGVVRERIAISIIMMDAVLYSVGGVIGTLHHTYFVGTPSEQMAFGAFFSAAEVIPLTFLTVEAWGFMQLGARQYSNRTKPFPHRWAVMFLIAVGFWNFLGAGVFGFLINLPIVSYFEIGTALTANHAHASMMGVYGMLAIAFAVFGLRYLIPEDKWPEKGLKFSFWTLNIGLLWMSFISLLPLGIAQLYKSVGEGYYEARSFAFIHDGASAVMGWMRMPGDVIFLVGIIPLIKLALLGIKEIFSKNAKETVLELPEPPLYEVVEDARIAEFAGAKAAEELPEQTSPYRSDRRG
jgi:nitric oxide reductase large subunit